MNPLCEVLEEWSTPHLLRCMFRSARGWKTVCALINMTALHPEASQTSFEAFALVCKDEKLLTPANFAPLLETALVFVDRHAKVCHSHSSRSSHTCLSKLWLRRTDMLGHSQTHLTPFTCSTCCGLATGLVFCSQLFCRQACQAMLLT